jgi:hypothetical protein
MLQDILDTLYVASQPMVIFAYVVFMFFLLMLSRLLAVPDLLAKSRPKAKPTVAKVKPSKAPAKTEEEDDLEDDFAEDLEE